MGLLEMQRLHPACLNKFKAQNQLVVKPSRRGYSGIDEMHPTGSVRVAICRGQRGTTLDQREYNGAYKCPATFLMQLGI